MPARIVSTNKQLFVDELGRSRIFRGTNVVVKTWPYVPDTSETANPSMSFNSRDITALSEYGVTAIRLGVMWPGVEPTKGNYNQTYLDEMVKIVQMCSDAGIYVLLDFHQDILSERFCGEGVPAYVIDANPSPNSGSKGFPLPLTSTTYPLDSDGNPASANCSQLPWGLYEATYSAGYAYDALYNNKNNARDHFVAYWTLVANTFLPFKNILGYDIINEPFYGGKTTLDIFSDVTVATASVANVKNLQPFYDVVSVAIRAVDSNAIIHFESVTLIQKDDYFTEVPGGSAYANKSVFNFHYYSSVQTSYDVNTTIGFRLNSSQSLGCGSFLGEFEMGYGTDGSNIPNIQNTLNAADSHLLSTTGWEYKDYITPGYTIQTGTNNGLMDPNTGLIRSNMAAVYSRTYAHTTGGVPLSMCFDNYTSAFSLVFSFSGNGGEAGTTELRTNFALIYPQGYSVQISASSGEFTASAANNSIFIVPNASNMPRADASVGVYVSATGAAASSVCTAYVAPSSSGAVAAGVGWCVPLLVCAWVMFARILL